MVSTAERARAVAAAAAGAVGRGGEEWEWGESGSASASGSLSSLMTSYSWSLTPGEEEQIRFYTDALRCKTDEYMSEEEQLKLQLALEIAYQSRSSIGSDGSDRDERLRHAVAVGLVLADLRMEETAVCAALLAGECEETGVTPDQIAGRLGPAVGSAVADVSQVWKLSTLLETSQADADAAQLEKRCQIMLAGCEDWRGVVVSLASRLVSMRQLMEEEEADRAERRGQPPAANDEGAAAADKAAADADADAGAAARRAAGRSAADAPDLRAARRASACGTSRPSSSSTASRSRSPTSTSRWRPTERVRAEHAEILDQTALAVRTALLADPVLARHLDWIRVQARTKAATRRGRRCSARRRRATLPAPPPRPPPCPPRRLRRALSPASLADARRPERPARPPRRLLPRQIDRLPAALHRQRQSMLCYRVLEVVHNLLPPVGVRSIKDYVTSPKPNGYQSLHSSVHIGQLTAELQVRTSEMHRYAEHGKASHWLYKTDEARPADDWQRVAELAATDIAASGPRAASGPLVMKSWRQAIAGSSFGAGAQPLEAPPPPRTRRRARRCARRRIRASAAPSRGRPTAARRCSRRRCSSRSASRSARSACTRRPPTGASSRCARAPT